MSMQPCGYNLLLPLCPAIGYVVLSDMRIEHVAFNVAEPVAMAHWYTEHLQMRVVRISGPPWFAHFLVDAENQSMIEIYYNAKAPVSPYGKMDPLMLHLAFAVDDVRATRARLLLAGATAEGEAETSPTGDDLAMLRDPWGFPVQLVKRAVPMPGPQ
jgi:glyoxylase I family protein